MRMEGAEVEVDDILMEVVKVCSKMVDTGAFGFSLQKKKRKHFVSIVQ